MITTIKIDKDHTVELNNSAGWFLVYRETFGRDILPDIMPLIESGLTMAVELLQSAEINGEVDGAKIAANIDEAMLSSMFINLSGLESITILQIIWAMAKNADDDIPPLREYYNQFERFPFDIVLPKVVKAIIDGTVSVKNAKRLLTLKKLSTGLTLTSSSSPASTEG